MRRALTKDRVGQTAQAGGAQGDDNVQGEERGGVAQSGFSSSSGPATFPSSVPTPAAPGQAPSNMNTHETDAQTATTGGITSALAQTRMDDSSTASSSLAQPSSASSTATADKMQMQQSQSGLSSQSQSFNQGGQQSATGLESSQLRHNPERAPKGTLRIKIVAGRNLAITNPTPEDAAADSSGRPEPYVVIQFEQNEFVSRPAHLPTPPPSVPSGSGKSGKPTTSRSSSYGPSLGIGSISRAFADAARRNKSGSKKGTPGGSGATTPKNAEGSGTGSAGSWLGQGGAMADPVWKEEVSFDLTSSSSLIYVSVYDRSKAGEGFLGGREIKPAIRDGSVVDNWFALQPRGEEKVTGEIWLQISYDSLKTRQHLSPKDFDILKLIGKGTFGKVFQVRKRDTKRIYAMKMLSKKDIVAKKEIAHTIGERKILQTSLECPFLVGLKFSFQTEEFLFFITDYKSGGELFWHLQKEGRFTEQRARFYIAELVLALEHLHKYNIVYR